MTTEQKLLMAAAQFIRRHPNGTDDTVKELMADAVEQAAKEVGKGWLPATTLALPDSPKKEAEKPRQSVGPRNSADLSDQDIRDLLHAGGLQTGQAEHDQRLPYRAQQPGQELGRWRGG